MKEGSLACFLGTLLVCLLSWCLCGAAAAQSRQETPILQINSNGHGAVIFGLAANADGTRLATASYDRTVRVWSLPALEPLAKINLPAGTDLEGAAYAIAYSPDGKTLVTSGYTGAWGEDRRSDGRGPWCLYVIDIEKLDKAEIRRAVCDLPRVANDLAFSRDGAYLAVALARGFGMRVYRTSDFTPVTPPEDRRAEAREHGTESMQNLEFDADGRLATATYDGFVRLYDKSFKLIAKSGLPEGRKPDTISFSPDGSRIAVGYTSRTADGRPILPAVHILSGSDLTEVARLDTTGIESGALWRVVWSADGKTLYAGGSWQKGTQYYIRRWSGPDLKEWHDIAAAPHPIVRITRMPPGGVAYTAEAPYLGTIREDDLEPRLRRPSLADFRLVGDKLGISADGRVVQFAFEPYGGRVAHFSLKTRELTSGPAPDGTVLKPLTVDTTRALHIGNWQDNDRPTLNGEPLKGLRTNEEVLSLDIARNRKSFTIGTIWRVLRYDAQGKMLGEIDVPYSAYGVVATEDTRLVVAALGDGTIRWLATGSEKDPARLGKGLREILAFFPHPDGRRSVAWTPSGYYMSSVDGEELIGWQVNRGRDKLPSFYKAGQFRRLYRPDVVRKTLSELDETKGIRRAEADDIAKEKLSTGDAVRSDLAGNQPPTLRIDAPADGSEFSGDEVTLKFTVRSLSGKRIDSVYAKVGGQAVSGASMGPILLQKGKERSGSFKLKVPPQDKVAVSLFAKAGGTDATQQDITLVRKSPITISVRRPKPTAYVVAVGVGSYKQSRWDLSPNFPRHDVDAFAAILGEQRGKVFEQIHFYKSPSGRPTLKDGEASAKNVRKGLKWLHDKGGEREDLLIFYFVGHGRGKYLLPHDYVDDLSTGIHKSEILKYFEGMNAKVVLFVDACQASDGFDQVGLAMDIKTTPAGIIAALSSASDQLAWGDDKGYFTTALIEALMGKGLASDIEFVSTSDVDAHFFRRMPQLTPKQRARVYLGPNVDHVILAEKQRP